MQETQNLTNQQKLEHLKAGCQFRIEGYDNLFETEQFKTCTGVYEHETYSGRQKQGFIEEGPTDKLVISYSNMGSARLNSVPLTNIEIL